MSRKTAAFLIALTGLSVHIFAPPLAHAFAVWESASPATVPVQHEYQRVKVQLFNRGGLVQQVRFGDRTYTLMPHERLTIAAPEGTEVYALDKGFGHKKGQLLFTVRPHMQHIFSID